MSDIGKYRVFIGWTIKPCGISCIA
jgi:hypothetical protein